jgi:hypothetical protein
MVKNIGGELDVGLAPEFVPKKFPGKDSESFVFPRKFSFRVIPRKGTEGNSAKNSFYKTAKIT